MIFACSSCYIKPGMDWNELLPRFLFCKILLRPVKIILENNGFYAIVITGATGCFRQFFSGNNGTESKEFFL